MGTKKKIHEVFFSGAHLINRAYCYHWQMQVKQQTADLRRRAQYGTNEVSYKALSYLELNRLLTNSVVYEDITSNI